MPGSAAIYSRRNELPFLHELKEVAAGGEVSWDVLGQLVVQWPGVRVVIEQLSPGRLTSHMENLMGFLQERCTLHDSALVRRIGKMRQCVTLTFMPEADAEGRCVALVRGLAGKLQGVYFHASSVHAPDGKLLASPKPGTHRSEPRPGPPGRSQCLRRTPRVRADDGIKHRVLLTVQ